MRAPCFSTLVLALPLTACLPSPSPGPGIELELGDGATPPSEYHRVPVRISRSRSAFAPAGLYLEAYLRRPSGARGRLVLDLPDPAAARSGSPAVSYSEHDAGGRPLFQSARAAGRIELSADPGCPCQTGRLELLFVDPGPDGVLGSADDRRRRVGSARLRSDGRRFCHPRGPLAIREELLVVGSRACPVPGRRGGAGAVAWVAGGSLAGGGWNQDDWYDEGWCGDHDPGVGEDWEEGWTDGFGWSDGGSSSGASSPWGSSDDGAWDGGGDWWDDVSGWGSDAGDAWGSADRDSWQEDAWTSDGEDWGDGGDDWDDDDWDDDDWDDDWDD